MKSIQNCHNSQDRWDAPTAPNRTYDWSGSSIWQHINICQTFNTLNSKIFGYNPRFLGEAAFMTNNRILPWTHQSVLSVSLVAAVFRTHRQPLASSLEGQVRILSTLRLCSHGQSLIPGSQRDTDSWLKQTHRVYVDHIQSPVSVVLECCLAPTVLYSCYFMSCF